jgi:transcriptional regulator of aroF, aroG, tyrA and aromatic amino acid transport
LIAGERGSGKSTFAAALHYLSPQAAQGNCYRLDSLVGAGHARDQLRGPGTLILEDLDRLSPQQQQTLVREIRKLPDNLRLVATATSPENLIPALAQHFATLAIKLPPLRGMRPALQRFSATTLRELAKKNESIKLEDAALDIMRRHDWPDNFNGLKDYLSAALARCRARAGDSIEQRDLADLAVSAKLPWRDWSRGLSYQEIMQQMERALFAELAAEHLSTRELARRLGISHTAVANKLRKYGLGKAGP